MTRYKVVYERKGCIGAASCTAIAPKYWKIEGADGRADLTGSSENPDGVWERIIDESELKENLEAAQGCPAAVIHIINLETGEQLI